MTYRTKRVIDGKRIRRSGCLDWFSLEGANWSDRKNLNGRKKAERRDE